MKKPNKLAKLFGKPVTIGGMSISVGAVALSTILAIGVIGGTVYTVSTRMHAKSNASANVQGQAGVSELTKSEDEQTGDASSSTNQAVAQADTQNEEGNLTSLPATEQANDSETGTNLNEDKTGTVPSGHKHHLTTKTLSESTCLVNGIAVETCDGCSYSRQYSLPLKEHTPSIWMTAANNTITGRAIRNRYCTTCGLLVATESVPVTPVIIQTSSGSNSSSGSNNSNDSQNSDNTNHSEQKHEHQYVLMSTVNPSCTVAGKKNFRCNCGATYVETIGATGHNVTSWSVTKAAECVSKGERQGECTNCHETVREDIPETGHTKGTWVTDTPASCLVAGTRHTDCTSCGMRMNEVIPATGHTESTWKTETSATCTANGLEYTECTTCHTKLNTRNVTALGHNWVEGATVSSTCTEQGNTSYECSRCHDTKQVVIGQANHTVSDWITVTTPTCTENGSKHKECTVCHAEIESEVIPATGHTVSEWMIDTPATCTGLGSRHKECTTCSATLTTESIPALGHSYPATPTSHTDANCLTDGADVYLCSRVGCNVTNSVRIPATGHRIGEWEITKAATDLAEGTRVKKCQNCGSVMETGTIAKLPHTHTLIH